MVDDEDFGFLNEGDSLIRIC